MYNVNIAEVDLFVCRRVICLSMFKTLVQNLVLLFLCPNVVPNFAFLGVVRNNESRIV